MGSLSSWYPCPHIHPSIPPCAYLHIHTPTCTWAYTRVLTHTRSGWDVLRPRLFTQGPGLRGSLNGKLLYPLPWVGDDVTAQSQNV